MLIGSVALTVLLFAGLAYYSLKYRYRDPFKQPVDFGAVMGALHILYVLSWNLAAVIIFWKLTFLSSLGFGLLAYGAQRLLFRIALERAVTARARELNIERDAAASIVKTEMSLRH